jgi:hypothetical protein
MAHSLLFSFDLSAGSRFKTLFSPGMGLLFHVFSFLVRRESLKCLLLFGPNAVFMKLSVITGL